MNNNLVRTLAWSSRLRALFLGPSLVNGFQWPVGSVLAGLPPERGFVARFGVQSTTRAIEARCKGVFEATTYISIGTKE
jgi:hypothetical protein